MTIRSVINKIEVVPIASTISTQEEIEWDRVDKIVKFVIAHGSIWDIKTIPPIQVIKYTDGLYIRNGHHRFMAAKRLGFENLVVINHDALNNSEKSVLGKLCRDFRKVYECQK